MLSRTEERVITVRKAAEICLSSSARENVPDEMRTSWKLSDVTKFQEEIKIAQKYCSDSTRAMRSTDG